MSARIVSRRPRSAVASRTRRVVAPCTSRYEVRLAESRVEVEVALRLRYNVFNLELGEGLQSSRQTGLDEDEFDSVCDHLIVVDRDTGQTVGTYRLQTARSARNARGFYADREFELRALPEVLLGRSVELGRACIAREHRNTRVLLSLWRGIAAYAARHGARALFGCCSIDGTDALRAVEARQALSRLGLVHDEIWADTTRDFACADVSLPRGDLADIGFPPLFRMYVRYGARICGGPALDREFGTTDFLVMLELDRLDRRSFDLFFSDDL